MVVLELTTLNYVATDISYCIAGRLERRLFGALRPDIGVSPSTKDIPGERSFQSIVQQIASLDHYKAACRC